MKLPCSKWIYLLVFLFFSQYANAQCSVNAGVDRNICLGSSAQLIGVVTGGSPTTYTWTSIPAGGLPATDTIIVSPTVTTKYIITISGNGCNDVDTVQVNVLSPPANPVINFNPNNSCSGTVVNFSTTNLGPGITYHWNFGDGGNATGLTATHQFAAYGSGSTNFNVILTAVGANGCGSSTLQTVSVVQGPHATLGLPTPAGGEDTVSFNGFITFFKCANGAQTSSTFNFVNTATPNTNVTYTIIWGDTGVNFTSSTNWTTVSHVYGKGIYALTFIVTNTGNGCSDTAHYKVFFGSNAAIGFATTGSTNICAPASLTFYLNNYQSNTLGTIYKVTFNDSTPPITFSQPPPDSIVHTFLKSSCGTTSTNGITNYHNAFSATLEVNNPCGPTSAQVMPIYVSTPPTANFTAGTNDTLCVNTNSTITNTSINGEAASQSGCDASTVILWSITPAIGWTLNSGSFGSDNGFTGPGFDPDSWTPGSNTLNVNFSNVGVYSVQIVAANSCGADTQIKQICISPAPVPSFTAAPLIGCAPLIITTNNTTPAVAGCSPATYVWTLQLNSNTCNPDSLTAFAFTGGTNASPVIRINNEGNYTLKMAAQNVCGSFNATPQNITVKGLPQVTMNIPANVCPGQTITPTSTALPCTGTITGYSWNFQGGTPPTAGVQNPGIVTMTTPGAHAVSLGVTNECGARTVNGTININTAPTANAGPDKQYCSGDSAQIGAAPVGGLTYSWSPATGLSATNIANPVTHLTATGNIVDSVTYILTVTNAGGCPAYDTVGVAAYPPATVNAGPDDSICAGLPVNLNGTHGGSATSVIWTSTNGGTFVNANTDVTSYTASITSGNLFLILTTNDPAGPCPAAKDSLELTVFQPPIANAGADDSLCNGTTVQLGTASQTGYVYTWSPATGLSNTTVSNPVVSLTTTNTVLTQAYQLAVALAGCHDTDTVVVSIFPNATANAGAPVSVCAGDSVTLTGTISGAASATWTSASGIFHSPDSLTTHFIPTITSGNAIVTLTTNQPNTVCPAASSSTNVTVNAIPVVTTNPLTQIACSGVASPSIILSANPGGTTFTWTGSSPDGITGFAASGNTNIIPPQTLVNPNNTDGIVVYVINPVYAGCPGPSVNDTITVRPSPSVILPASQTVCSNVATVVASLSSNMGATTFSWTAAGTGSLTGYTTNGNGDIPVQTIINNGVNLDSVTYTVTPFANGCNGPTAQYIIRVYPSPNVNLPAAQSICSGNATTLVNLTGNVAGTTFNWSAGATAGISGYTANGNATIPVQTLLNANNTAGTVTYAITPTANGCPGATQNYTITVKPLPTVTATIEADTVCNGAQDSIALASNVANTTFSWTVTAPGTVTGMANGNGAVIQQALSNSGTNFESVTYTITPTANGCPGLPITVDIIVRPGVAVQFSLPNQTVCSSFNSQAVTITSPSPNVNFSWTSVSNGIGGVAASGANIIPVQTLTSTFTTPVTVFYNITADYTGCPGTLSNYQIVVYPTPVAVLPASQTICSGSLSQSIPILASLPGTTFTWAGTSPDGITGFTAGGNSNLIPSQILTNAGTVPGIVIYSVTPTVNGCVGPVANDTITVNPLPVVTPVPAQTICSDSVSTAVTLSSASPGTTFSWVATHSGNLTGFSVNGNGNIPAQTVINNSTIVDSLVYTVTPTAAGCVGPTYNYPITVNPQPDVILPAAQTVCSNANTAIAVFTSSVNGTTYSWGATATNGVTGFTANGNGNIPVETLVNPGNTAGFVTYSVTPTANGCQGLPGNYVVTVNPIPDAIATPALDTICNATQTNIALTSGVANTQFSWTVNAPATITGATTGSGNAIQQILSNNGQNFETVTYTITPNAAGCIGAPLNATVVVKPGVTVQFTPGNQTICSGQTSLHVDITASSPGVTFNWTSQANGITGVAASGTDSIPLQTLTNPTNAPITVVYNVTAGYAGCNSQLVTYNIAVNPAPTVVLPVDQTICSGQATNPVNLSSPVAGASFTWTASSPNGVTGFAASGNGNIITPQVLTNAAYTAGTVVFVITPSANGCAGPSSNYTVTVNPLPDVVLPPAQTICNGATSNAVNITSNVANTIFTWTSNAAAGVTGNTTNGNGNIPAQTLNNTGVDSAAVVYTVVPTASNCAGSSANYIINVYPTPTIGFTPAPQTICTGQTTQLVNITSATPNVSISWTATLPNGITGAATSGTNTIPAETLYNNTVNLVPQGLTIQYTAQVNTTGLVCPGIPANYTTTVMPHPQIDFTQSLSNGCSPLSINFLPNTQNIAGPDSLTFDFGDGTPQVVIHGNAGPPVWPNVSHWFYNNSTQPVTYNVSLIVHARCIDTTVIKTVTLLPDLITAFFTPSVTSGCEPLAVNFTDQSTGAGSISYCFNYNTQLDSCMGGGANATPGSTIAHVFTAGNYTVALYATNGYGCAQDTAYQTIQVAQAPVSDFSFADSMCAGSNVAFTEHATSPSGSFVNQYNWNLGDNTLSTQDNPVHNYTTGGPYNVCLIVASSAGCADTACKTVTILNRPHAVFTEADTCVNTQPIVFANASAGAQFYSWQFGDGNTSGLQTPTHSYGTAGVYTATLIASTNTCSDTTHKPVNVYAKPGAAFTLPYNYYCGVPASVNITNTSVGAVGYNWDFGNGTTSTNNNPQAVYNAQGTYGILLTAANQFGCIDTASKPFTVYPMPVVQLVGVQPSQGCAPTSVDLTVTGSNINQLHWDYGDGQIGNSAMLTSNHTYADSGIYSIRLTVTSFATCIDSVILPDTVTVHGLPLAAFDYSMNVRTEPTNGQVQFMNQSTNNAINSWDFGDDSISMETNPAHLYHFVDDYTVKLVVTSTYGCKDSTSKTIEVIKKTLFVPNAFSPGFEGGNNLVSVWKPSGIGLLTYHAQIFDKWGELLWESTALTSTMEPLEGWDGSYQGKPCQQGVYVWKIDATFEDGTRWKGMQYKGEERKTIGSVTLIR